MLEISETQLDAFRQARLTDFALHLSHRAQRLHPKAVAHLDEAQQVAIMQDVIAAARTRDLTTTRLMERFCDLSMVLGIGFETSERWARDIFANPAMTPEGRLRKAEASAVFLIRES